MRDDAQPYTFERDLLDVVSDKWAMLTVNHLGAGTRRFGELHRAMTGISHKMLTQTLRTLERNGIVNRIMHASVPPHVDYVLTPVGRDLLETMTGLCGWARRSRDSIESARASFDRGRAAQSASGGAIDSRLINPSRSSNA